MPYSDAELVAIARAGDLTAFDQLVETYQAGVFSLAYRILRNADDAADIQQDTFVRAWRSLRTFRGDAGFSTWLHRITVNLCLTRKRKRTDDQPLPEEHSQLIVHSDSAACIVAAETSTLVRRVLAAMPVHHRALLVMREIEERPFEEIAAILNCSVGSARVRASRARDLLRERLRPYLTEESDERT